MLFGQLRAPPLGDSVVLAPAAPHRRTPAGLDMAEPLESVQQGVEQAFGPVQFAAGYLIDVLEDRVPVALAGGEYAQHYRRRGRRYQVLRDMHPSPSPRGTMHSTARYYRPPSA